MNFPVARQRQPSDRRGNGAVARMAFMQDCSLGRRTAGCSVLLTTLLGLVWSSAVVAQPEEHDGRSSAYVAYIENDDLWPDKGTDKNYTNGFRFTLDKNYAMWGFGRLARIFGQTPVDCADRSTNAGPDAVCVSTSFHVGQQFYTPDEISESEIIANDRPYAGWAYVGGTWRVSSEVQSAQTDVYVGATGPWSFAEDVQTWWHDEDNLPLGWAHQIDGRFGVIVGHSRRWVPVELDWRKGRWLELVPYIGGTAGTIVDDVYAGLRVKVGWNILLEWLETGIGPRIPTREAGDLEAYGIFDVQGRLVGYNAFLNSKRHEFEREWRIWDYGIGFGLRWKRLGFSYRTVQISPEHSLTGPHDYRAVRFTYRVGR